MPFAVSFSADGLRACTQEEIRQEVIALQDMGHKRLALEAGEHPLHNPIEYILESIKTIYSIKHKNGAIRRVNVNIAATTVENYRKLKEAGIGTYILFQETYNKQNYEALHPTGPKKDYAYHTEAMDRAMQGRIPCYIVIIAAFVTAIQLLLQAFLPPIYEMLGVYLAQMIPNSALSFSTRSTDSSMRSSEISPSRTASSTAGICFQ